MPSSTRPFSSATWKPSVQVTVRSSTRSCPVAAARRRHARGRGPGAWRPSLRAFGRRRRRTPRQGRWRAASRQERAYAGSVQSSTCRARAARPDARGPAPIWGRPGSQASTRPSARPASPPAPGRASSDAEVQVPPGGAGDGGEPLVKRIPCRAPHHLVQEVSVRQGVLGDTGAGGVDGDGLVPGARRARRGRRTPGPALPPGKSGRPAWWESR